MQYENKKVFSYVHSLLQGVRTSDYCIRNFAEKHNTMDKKLKELKDIIIRYYPERGNDNLTSVLFDIMNCEIDLAQHCQVEDFLFVPAVERLESDTELRATQSAETGIDEQEDTEKSLSQRECEIVAAVACGMSNKEIADKLCISIHTVTTHRRNICNKLQIHTPAGLTIYAIVHKLVSLQDIKMS